MKDEELDRLFNQIQEIEPTAGFQARLWARIVEQKTPLAWWRWPQLVPVAAGVAMAWLMGFSIAAKMVALPRPGVAFSSPPSSLSATGRAAQVLATPMGGNSLVAAYQVGGRL